jgi:radical SAM superfamily enzyme YgiQ (UPF0313 family)
MSYSSDADSLPIIDDSAAPVHPLQGRAKILLSSVFGPYSQDDEYGSRALNPMELYHNQVTRVQGTFSLRMFHRSWGLMMIQSNIEAPCMMLDFPDLARFTEEISNNHYDVVGISAITPNIHKVKKMCELIREHLPEATIVIGGHVANIPDLNERVDADHIVKGEGIRWFRHFLGEDTDRSIRHPMIVSGIGTHNVGISPKEKPGDVAATVIPSVGCPLGCNFCSTSAMFGGKGKFINFYSDGDQLFDVMCQLEENMKVKSFFMMDENFLLHRKRALRLLELMEKNDKAWALYVFSSANVLRTYTIEQLVGLGVSWVWMGLEGKNSQYKKLHGIDTLDLIRRLQSHGIRVLGSTIIALDEHTPDNIDEAIAYAVRHDTDFHQFMLYTPIPGTPLHAELTERGLMKDDSEFDFADIHGQHILNYYHPHIKDGQEAEFILRAFQRDFEVNGPSVPRIVRTTLAGWKRYKNHPDPRIQRRYLWETNGLASTYSAMLWAIKRYYRKNSVMRAKMGEILRDLYRHFGLKARLAAMFGGPYVLRKMLQEEKRLAAGWTQEPPTYYDRNFGPAGEDSFGATLCRQVTSRITPAPIPGPTRAEKPEPASVS